MMEHGTAILNRLLDRYERSGHCLPGRTSNQRVSLSLSQGKYPPYRENDPAVMEINESVRALGEEGLVSYTWRKGYEGWLLDKVYLNLENLPQAYQRAGRVPLADAADALDQILCQAAGEIHTPWKLRFLEDERFRIQKSLHPSRLLPEDRAQAQALLKVLAYTERGPELMRIISTACFHDSKYLEKHLRPQLCSIARAYVPELISYRAAGEEVLTQNVVLEQLGILPYPEILEFCGDVKLIFPGAVCCAGLFQKGFCLQSENLERVSGIGLEHIHSLLFVENRTNYRALLLRGVPDGQLIVFHGGFYSPARKRFFRMLAQAIPKTAKVLFWGDIDLGGFLMFTRLKRELFPDLTAHRMGLEDYCAYRQSGVERSQPYLSSLRQNMEEQTFDPSFLPVAEAILKNAVTVEQEIMLPAENTS